MTPRENVLATLNYENPEHVHYDGGVPWFYLNEIHSEEALAPIREAEKRIPDEIQTVMPGPAAGWKQREDIPEGYIESEWGAVGRVHLPYITYSPLGEGWHLLKDYKFPDPYAPGRFDKFRETAEANRHKYVRAWAFSALWEHIWMVRGYENSLVDMYTNPDEFCFLRDKIVDYQVGIMRQIHEIGVDGIHFTDDLGTQQSLMIPPETWREFLKPAYAIIFEEAKKNGTHIWFHSDGNIREIIPDLMALGVRVLNPIQPGLLDLDEIIATFGKDLCYSGGVDVQGVLPFGKPAEIRAVVKKWANYSHELGGGMFIAPTNLVTPETPLENIMAYLDACHELC